MNRNQEILKGYFLELSAIEEKDLLEFLREHHFEPDKNGIKDFLLSHVYPEPVEATISPEMERLVTGGMTAAVNFVKKKIGF